jgi:hypothetical protein
MKALDDEAKRARIEEEVRKLQTTLTREAAAPFSCVAAFLCELPSADVLAGVIYLARLLAQPLSSVLVSHATHTGIPHM